VTTVLVVEDAHWADEAALDALRTVESAALAEEAVTSLEALPPGPELAEAYSWLARIAMLANRAEEAERWARKAIEQRACRRPVGGDERPHRAGRHRDHEPRAARGACTARPGGGGGARARQRHGAQPSPRQRRQRFGRLRRYDLALPYFERSLAFASERDLDVSIGYSTAWLARVRFEQGDWEAADALLAGAVTHQHVHVRIAVRLVQGRLAARRGGRDTAGLLDEAWELALGIGEIQRLGPVAAGRAELAWLAGRSGDVADLAGETLPGPLA
jgi:tetratricopeptide (TPR) repeat protein